VIELSQREVKKIAVSFCFICIASASIEKNK
jgi:hypothetical protein